MQRLPSAAHRCVYPAGWSSLRRLVAQKIILGRRIWAQTDAGSQGSLLLLVVLVVVVGGGRGAVRKEGVVVMREEKGGEDLVWGNI